MNPDSMATETRALLIEMRKYVLHHGILLGECVAWNALKALYGTGQDQMAEEVWLRDYRQEGAE